MKSVSISILALLFLLSCGNRSTDNNTQSEESEAESTVVSFTEQQLANAGIEIGSPSIEKISKVLKLQGSIDVPPQSMVSLSFPLGGYLKTTTMLPGMKVKKGEVLGVMEDMQFIQLQQDYLTANEKFQVNNMEYLRQQELNATKASSDKAFQQAKAEMETSRILKSALGQKLELIGIDPKKLNADNISKSVNVISPIDGFVSKVNVNVGKYTAPTDMLFELIDPRDIHLGLDVFENDLSSLSIGQKVIAYSNGHPEKKYEAEIILIAQSLNSDRIANIHCHFEKYNQALTPGMFMNGEVTIDDNRGLVVPEEAIVRWENAFYVFVETGAHQFVMTSVTPGILTDGKQQIQGQGIDEHTRLVVKNAFSMLMKIKNTEEEE